MYDWLYAIPLAVIILGAGITYFMSSSLFGPFCLVIGIAIIIIMRKSYNTKANAAFLQCTGTIEKPNAGHCSECDSDWLLSDCDTEIDQETWELPSYTIYICPKCKAELDDYFYEEDEEFI